MPENEDNINLSDLIDINLLQKLQDLFAKAMNVASITLDTKGPITKSSNYTDFCKINIQNNINDTIECDLNNPKWGKIAFKKNGPYIFKCRGGLTNFVVPLVLYGKLLGSIVCGQILTEPPNEEIFRKIARRDNLNEDEYIEALRKIRITSDNNIKAAANLLLLLANTISEIGYKNLELTKKAQREVLYRNMVEAIRSTLDISETLKAISYELSKLFNIQRVAILEFHNKKDLQKFHVREEYKTTRNIKSSQDVSGYDKIGEFAAKFILTSQNPLVVNSINESTYPDFFNDFYRSIGIKSVVWLPIMSKNQLWGFISLSKINNYNWTDEDILLLKATADQLYIAINQAELYEQEKKTAQREALLRKTIDVLRSKFNPDDIKKYFIEMVGNYFNADICIFADYDKETNKFHPFRFEKLKSSEIESLVGTEPEIEFPEFIAKIKKRKAVIIKDIDKILAKKNLLNYKAIQTMQKSETKSAYGLPVEYKNQIIGILIILYVKQKRVLTKEELDFMKILRDRVGTALYQAELLSTTKQQIERETLIRNTIENIRGSLNLDITTKSIVDNIGSTFNANICVILKWDSIKNYFFVDEYSEYRSSDDEITFIGHDSTELKYEWFGNMFKNNISVNFSNVETFISENNLQNTATEYFLQEYKIKSAYCNHIYYANKLLGYLILIYTKNYVELKDNDKEFLDTLAIQVGTALYQADLYSVTKQQAERERILRDITNKIRSSLDFEKIKHEIVNQIGKLFNADRVSVAYYDYKINNYVITKEGEYRSSDKIKTFVDVDFTGIPGFAKNIRDTHVRGKDIIFDDLEKYLDDYNFSNTDVEKFYRDFGFISAAAINMYYEEVFLGDLVITFEHKRTFSEGEIKFLKVLADQVGVAFHQAELLSNEKKAAEREALIRTIIETIRSSLDIDGTKRKIVDILGKTLNADICVIAEYDKNRNEFLIIEDEYLSSDEIIGYKGTNPNQDVPNFLCALKNGLPLLINNKKITFDGRDHEFEIERETIEKYNVNSAYAVPLFYQKEFLGILSIHYVKYKHYIEEDEVNLVNDIANQVAIALHQANLYKTTQVQAGTEKINRKMIEILRSSLNKNTIKHLLVQNIGKFVNADRVFFSEYDPKRNIYLPVDRYSEYLSNNEEKSFIGYDWTQDIAYEYIQPLIEKRELIIPCINEYAKIHPKSPNFISRFTDANVKSSYNFPVLYQEKIVGYFCIEFTGKVCKKLSEEDINRIRDICIQAGIALYQSELYLQAIESAKSKELFIASISNELQLLLNNIMEISKILSETELSCDSRITKYLDDLSTSNKQIMELRDSVNNITQIESDSFKLNYERIDIETIIMEVINSIQFIFDNKIIHIDVNSHKIEILADKEKLTQILYSLLSNVIKLVPNSAYLTVKSEVQNNELIISISVSGRELTSDVQNTIFETFKPLDSDFKMPRKDLRLSLSISKKLIELHNGHIHVDSTEDKGTKLWFVLPNVFI